MTSALAVARLQNVKTIVFDRELDVLHVFEMPLEECAHFHERFVRGRHFLRKIDNRMRRAHTGHYVFTLRVD